MLTGCASTGPKKVNISKQNIVIGWKNQKTLGPGYYVLIEEISKENWEIKKVSKKPIIGRKNKKQEVLFVNKDLNYVQPFFEKPLFYNPSLKTFQCTPLLEIGEKSYTPCNSRLTTANAGASLARNAVALITTLGLGSGVDRGIDIEKISKIIEQTNLLEKIRLYDSLVEKFLLEKREYYDFISNISVNIEKIKDNTGLFLVKPNDISLSRRTIEERVELPKDFDENFGRYSQEDIKNLFANKKIEIQPYLINPILKTYHYYTLKCFGIIPKNYAKIEISYNNQNYTPPQKINIPIIIDSCDLINPYPSNFLAKDENLLVKVMSLDREKIKLLIKNKTTSYIKVLSITLYYNDKVLNISNLNIELPPQSLKEDVYIPTIGFNLLPERVKEFKKVTKNNLNFPIFTFGLAVKYNIVATNIEKSLYKVNTYNLATILSQN